MPDGVSIRLTGDWKALTWIFSVARFDEAVQALLWRATQINALVVRREVRENLKTGKYAPSRDKNAALTLMIKKPKTRPLIDSGQLFQAVTSKVHNWGVAEIGVARVSPTANVAVTVHEGAVVPVTKKMRAMFQALADASDGKRDPSTLTGRAAVLFARRSKGWKPLKKGTTEIRIPARPFIREVVESSKVQRRLYENWLEAASAAVAGVSPKLRTDV